MHIDKTIEVSHLKSLIFLGGLSGAGCSTAMAALSDLGFFINENLPVALCSHFLEHTRESPQRFLRTALAPDVDSSEKLELFLKFLDEVGHPRPNVQTIFLEAKTDTIVKRYGQTRRPHPSFDANLDLTLEDAIERERRTLSPLRDRANLVIDTSELNLHELRKQINAFVSSLGSKTGNLVRINLIAFGFKHGIPNDCDLVADVRFLPNPFFVPALKVKTGLDSEVKDFVLSKSEAQQFIETYMSSLKFLIEKHAEAGKLYLNIGLGCTGGRHRSVVLVEELGKLLKDALAPERFTISTRYRDILKPQ